MERGLAVLPAFSVLHSAASSHILCVYFGGRVAFFIPLPLNPGPRSFFLCYLPKGKKNIQKFEGEDLTSVGSLN